MRSEARCPLEGGPQPLSPPDCSAADRWTFSGAAWWAHAPSSRAARASGSLGKWSVDTSFGGARPASSRRRIGSRPLTASDGRSERGELFRRSITPSALSLRPGLASGDASRTPRYESQVLPHPILSSAFEEPPGFGERQRPRSFPEAAGVAGRPDRLVPEEGRRAADLCHILLERSSDGPVSGPRPASSRTKNRRRHACAAATRSSPFGMVPFGVASTSSRFRRLSDRPEGASDGRSLVRLR